MRVSSGYVIEFVRIGAAAKVTAIDPATGDRGLDRRFGQQRRIPCSSVARST